MRVANGNSAKFELTLAEDKTTSDIAASVGELSTEDDKVYLTISNVTVDDDLTGLEHPNVVERLALTLLRSDKIQLIQGRAVNTAHEASLFKQMGIRTRHDVVDLICDKLEQRGKIIERINF